MPGIPLLRIAVVLALPAAFVLALSGVMRAFDDPIAAQGEAQALVWADRVFTSEQQFSEWLDSRGVDYAAWVERHPGVAPWEAPPAPPEKAAYVSPSASSDDGGGGFDLGFSLGVSSTSVFVALVSMLGLLLVAASAMLVVERRPEVAAAGLSLLVGAGLPLLLT